MINTKLPATICIVNAEFLVFSIATENVQDDSFACSVQFLTFAIRYDEHHPEDGCGVVFGNATCVIALPFMESENDILNRQLRRCTFKEQVLFKKIRVLRQEYNIRKLLFFLLEFANACYKNPGLFIECFVTNTCIFKDFPGSVFYKPLALKFSTFAAILN